MEILRDELKSKLYWQLSNSSQFDHQITFKFFNYREDRLCYNTETTTQLQ